MVDLGDEEIKILKENNKRIYDKMEEERKKDLKHDIVVEIKPTKVK
jgi:hypothetical protein